MLVLIPSLPNFSSTSLTLREEEQEEMMMMMRKGPNLEEQTRWLKYATL